VIKNSQALVKVRKTVSLFPSPIISVYLHKDDIRAKLCYAVKRNHKIFLPAENAEKSTRTRHNQGIYAALYNVHLNIADKAQSLSVAQIYNLAISKVANTHANRPLTPSLCPRRAGVCLYSFLPLQKLPPGAKNARDARAFCPKPLGGENLLFDVVYRIFLKPRHLRL